MHARRETVTHRFRYRIFSLYLDLDELETLHQRLRFFAYNRFNIVSFHDRDHGPGDGTPARDWAAAQFRRAGVGWQDGPIRLLCFPRLWGFVFNPLAVYFAFHPDGRPAAILYQVSNTFSERHSYLLPAYPDARGDITHSCAKAFHVSPFFGRDYRYQFRLRAPDERLGLHIRLLNGNGAALVAHQSGVRQALSDGALLGAVTRHPLMTVKIVAAIHWQALKLWRKGAVFHKKPQPPFDSVSQDATYSTRTLMEGDAR